MHFEDLNWMDVESYLRHDDRVVLITGACEQHAYLSLLTDIRVPTAVARAACEQERVLIAPPINYGISPDFTAFPGTVSLSPEAFVMIVREVIAELARQGFRRILISNGHGGNSATLKRMLPDLSQEHAGVKFAYFEPWNNSAVNKVAEEAGLKINHASWAEAYPFTRVAENPQGVKPEVSVPWSGSPEAIRAALGDGNFGGPYEAPDDITQRSFNAAVTAMIEALRGLKD